MDELSVTLLDRLIEKTFEIMTQDARLSFVERLFADMPADSQERFLRRMLQSLPRAGAERMDIGPPFMRRAMEEYAPRDIGPWRMCCRMMANVDRASRLEALDASRPARVFSALADETRIKIVKLLSEGEKHVDQLARSLESPQSTVSHHLRVLREAGLVRAEKRGRNIHYSIGQSVEPTGSAAWEVEMAT